MSPFRPSAETRKGKGDAAAHGEYGQHPDHDSGISGGQDFANADGLGKRLRKMDARRLAQGQIRTRQHFRGQLTNCPNTNSQVRESQKYSEAIAAVAGCAMKLLENFPHERSRLQALSSVELGWKSWNNDDEDWTKSAM